MRDDMKELGSDPDKINPLVPVDLVIDHSMQADVIRSENALQANMDIEFQRNRERFAFLRWGDTAFRNMLVVPPGSGIVHLVNLEYLGRVVFNSDWFFQKYLAMKKRSEDVQGRVFEILETLKNVKGEARVKLNLLCKEINKCKWYH